MNRNFFSITANIIVVIPTTKTVLKIKLGMSFNKFSMKSKKLKSGRNNPIIKLTVKPNATAPDTIAVSVK